MKLTTYPFEYVIDSIDIHLYVAGFDSDGYTYMYVYM